MKDEPAGSPGLLLEALSERKPMFEPSFDIKKFSAAVLTVSELAVEPDWASRLVKSIGPVEPPDQDSEIVTFPARACPAPPGTRASAATPRAATANQRRVCMGIPSLS